MIFKWLGLCLLWLFISGSALADEYAEAAGYFQDRQYRSAVIVLKNILQADPENYHGRLLLGRTHLEMLNAAAAIKELKYARELSVEDTEYLIPLSRAYLYSRKHDLVFPMEEQLQDFVSPAKQSELLTVIGYAHLGKNHLADAKDYFRRAFELDENVYSLVALARIDILERNYERAQGHLERALAKQADSIEALVAIGEVLAALERDDQAIGYFEQALKIEGRLHHVRIMLAEANIRAGDLISARQNIEWILQRNSSHLEASVILLRLQFQAGDYQDAQLIGDRVLRQVPQHVVTHFLLGATHYKLENFEQARYFLEKYRLDRPLDIVAARLLASVYLLVNAPDKAVELLGEMDSNYQHKDPDLLNLLGRAHLQTGNFQEGRKVLDRAMAADPSRQATRDMLLLGALAEGDMVQAIETLEKRVTLPESTPQTHVMLIMSYLRINEFDKALGAAVTAIDKHPDWAGLYYLKGLVYESMQDIAQAKVAYQQVLRVDEQHIHTLTALANIESRQGNTQAAQGYFKKILKVKRNHLNALMALAQLSVRDGDATALVGWLVKARDRNPGSSIPVNFLVNHYLQTGQLDKASSEANSFYLNNKNKIFALSLMARTSISRKDNETARSFLEQIIQINQRDEVHRLQLANLLIRMKDFSGAVVVLDEALRVNKASLQALGLKFRLLLRKRDLAAASALVDNVEKHYPSHHLLYQLKGDLYAIQGEKMLAAEEYQKGFDRTKKPYFANALAQHYLSEGNVERAAQILERHLLSFSNDAQGRLSLASIYKESGNSQKAITHYEILASSRPDDFLVLNNLAGLYWGTKDSRSLSVAKKAYEQAVDRPEVEDTYGWILLHNGDKKKALTLLQSSASKAPTNPDIRFHLAQAMYDNGQYQQAKKELDRLLRDFSGFSEQTSAIQLSDKILGQLEAN